MKNFNDMMKQMQAKLAETQNKISQMEATGVSGGSAVSITIDGNGLISKVKIDSAVISSADDIPVLEDLIVAAYSNARTQLEEKMQQENPMSGLLPPGMKLPF